VTEEKLVEKLKVELKKWVDDLKLDVEIEKRAELELPLTEKQKNETEKLFNEDFERHNKIAVRIEKATKFKQLTDLVRDFNWDAQSWIEFVFENGFESKIETGLYIASLSGFDT